MYRRPVFSNLVTFIDYLFRPNQFAVEGFTPVTKHSIYKYVLTQMVFLMVVIHYMALGICTDAIDVSSIAHELFA